MLGVNKYCFVQPRFDDKLSTKKGTCSYPQCKMQDLERRDHVDSTRDDSPLQVAPGSVIFDTSNMSAEAVVSELAEMFRMRVEG